MKRSAVRERNEMVNAARVIRWTTTIQRSARSIIVSGTNLSQSWPGTPGSQVRAGGRHDRRGPRAVLGGHATEGAAMMERYADISHRGRYRWSLIRRWAEGPAVCWIMLNPSTADGHTDDPTIRTIMRRSEGWGYGALVVVNLYPFRSSQPFEARQWAESAGSVPEQQDNLAIILECVGRCERVIAAWGAAPWAGYWGRIVVKKVRAKGHQVWCLGTTQSGAPTHPLARGQNRIAVEQEPVRWP